MTFHSVGNFIIPTDFHSIIFSEGLVNHQAEKPWDYPHDVHGFFAAFVALKVDARGVDYNVVPPNDVCWFITPLTIVNRSTISPNDS